MDEDKDVQPLQYYGISEISNLILIRGFVQASQDNYNMRKEQVVEMRSMLILLDRLISDKILSPEFKSIVNFEQAAQAQAEVRKMNDIKSGIKR